KGTNYYYNRYRPGLGTSMFGVFLVAGGAFHYLALYMSWKRQKEFVERYIKFARQTAWGENLSAVAATVPTPVESDEDEEVQQPRNRRERRMQQRGTRKDSGKKAPKKRTAEQKAEAPQGGPTGARKRVVAENGKVLVVDSLGDVYLEQEDEEGKLDMFLLDVSLDSPCETLSLWESTKTSSTDTNVALGRRDLQAYVHGHRRHPPPHLGPPLHVRPPHPLEEVRR
ncbi:hypothetical protein IMZ48_45165, partial [Candidatus Bathyarchaeota archaeon]|nr:hypothetical protein [Candidatus Bathyarchaeota archaeon]